jgi:hypothetical protein
MLCADLVQVRWKDQSGHSRKAVANLEDISTSGVCLQMERPVALDTHLWISHPKAEYEGNVRYCLFREFGYFIGVQFAPGCRWSRRDYRPMHLLDLRRLVKRCASREGKPVEAAPAADQ